MPDDINPIFDKLEDANGASMGLCDSTIGFLQENNKKMLNLQTNLDDVAKWIEQQRE